MKATLNSLNARVRPPRGGARRSRHWAAAATFLIIAMGSLCFCGKGILIKLAYRLELDTLTVLLLRNLISLPFFLGGLVWSEWRARVTGAGSLRCADLARVVALGFIGYYLSSLVNFLGLQHVSVGLERMILFTYPSLVMAGAAVYHRRSPRPAAVMAMLLAYAGIALGFWSELHTGPQGNLPLGAALVFASALTYACFTLISGEMVQRLGATRLMSWVLVASALMVMAHFTVTHEWRSLASHPVDAWKLGWSLALFGTVIPSYLFGWGLKRAGATTASVIGMVGPVGTVVLAALVLGEPVSPWQLTGLALTLAGGLGVSLGGKPDPTPRAGART